MSTTAPIPPILPDVTPAQAVPAVTPAPISPGAAQYASSASQGASQGASPSGAVTSLVASQGPAQPIDDQPDLRLVIEEDKSAGSYVYITMDPRTGKVIAQIPREELLKMRDAPGYTPGSVVNSRS